MQALMIMHLQLSIEPPIIISADYAGSNNYHAPHMRPQAHFFFMLAPPSPSMQQYLGQLRTALCSLHSFLVPPLLPLSTTDLIPVSNLSAPATIWLIWSAAGLALRCSDTRHGSRCTHAPPTRGIAGTELPGSRLGDESWHFSAKSKNVQNLYFCIILICIRESRKSGNFFAFIFFLPFWLSNFRLESPSYTKWNILSSNVAV